MEQNEIEKAKPKQRLSEKEALQHFENIIKSFSDPLQNAIEYISDYAGGSREFINKDVVLILIKRLTK